MLLNWYASTIAENPVEVTTSGTVGEIESTPPIEIPLEPSVQLPSGLEGMHASHSGKLFVQKFDSTGAAVVSYLPVQSLYETDPLYKEALDWYSFFNYEKLRIRLTMSAPKSVTGLISLSWLPYNRNWFDNTTNNFNVHLAATLAAGPLKRALLLRRDSHMMSISEPLDAMIEIPWSYAFPFLHTDYIREFTSWFASAIVVRRPEIGEPILVIETHSIQSHTTVLPKVQFILTLEYVGLRFFGRNTDQAVVASSIMDLQMMSAAAGVAATAALTAGKKKLGSMLEDKVNNWSEEVIDTGTDWLCETTGVCFGTQNEESNFATETTTEHSGSEFTSPTTVMPSIIGDTVTMGPSTSVGLRTPINTHRRVPHKQAPDISVREFLSRPQLIFEGTSTKIETIASLLISPTTHSFNYFTWFDYFSQIARYWRGSLRFHFVMCGHPFIEQRFQISYNPNLYRSGATTFSSFPPLETYIGNFSGTKTFSVTIPYMHPMEYLPVDLTDLTTDQTSCGEITWTTQIINTAFEVETGLPYMVFISAGPDFSFYDPTPPGYNNVASSLVTKAPSEPVAELDLQISLPGNPDPIRLMKRYLTPDPGIYMPLRTLKSLMYLWSRNLSSPINSFRFPLPLTILTPDTDWVWSNNIIYSYSDYVSYCSCLFLYWRGSMSFKTVFNSNYVTGNRNGSAFVTLGDPFTTNLTYSNVVNLTTFPIGDSSSNWGSGTIVTMTADQPTMEFNIPMRHNMGVSFTNVNGSDNHNPWSRYGYIGPPAINTNLDAVETIESVPTAIDLIYRKAGQDFSLYMESLIPPPSFWSTRGFAHA
jgi:hypothetical protein